MTDTPLDFGDPADLERLRVEFRAWLSGHPLPERPADEPLPVFLHRWHRLLHAGGWVGLDVPEQYGGRGLTALHQVTVSDELGAQGAPGVPRIGYLAHALLRFGSEEQRRRLLPRMLAGEDVWCQGFSEPGAGSDLAGMSTCAERRPEGHYIVNGQKLWTSYAQYSGLCLLLARTGRTAPPHTSLSAFVLPLDRPGVTVRPLRAANGDDEFCELFLDDVRLEESERIGAEGDGWPLAMTTVAYERNALDTGHLSKYGLLVERLRRAAHERRGPLPDGLLSDIGRCVVDYRVLVAHARRRTAERLAGQGAGPESSVDKLLMTRAEQRLYETALKVFPEELSGAGGEVLGDYFYSRAASVYGGTSQIQRNIIAKRLLRLPAGPRA
ncbi:acyl-CoA dehydrogenase family protein [Streptomyces sp. IBSBF 2953]|uniref:acyl-CoA dehydrogenase family protein n=1 Tax=Streptomyces TaxID=1883 RepID=UPI00211A2DD3|nr:acyl-CoA dehydrogenase family protein [Streptomyces scabiei]MCQ9183664.1 acyl-CoA dehydrogenase family protein [Streptomyces hayashii]MDX3113590.1 acyl-CoA dehydrogenase family protein [Streptomyces scabiei]